MSAAKCPRSESSESVNVNPVLSPEAQKDLEDALGDEKKEAWVEETRSNLLKAFALERRVDAKPQKDVDIYNAVEGNEENLRYTLKTIYDKHGRLAMYDRGTDDLARHWVVGYKSIRGTQTVQKVILYVERTKWTPISRVSESPAAKIDAGKVARSDDEDWTVVDKPVGGFGFRHFRPEFGP